MRKKKLIYPRIFDDKPFSIDYLTKVTTIKNIKNSLDNFQSNCSVSQKNLYNMRKPGLFRQSQDLNRKLDNFLKNYVYSLAFSKTFKLESEFRSEASNDKLKFSSHFLMKNTKHSQKTNILVNLASGSFKNKGLNMNEVSRKRKVSSIANYGELWLDKDDLSSVDLLRALVNRRSKIMPITGQAQIELGFADANASALGFHQQPKSSSDETLPSRAFFNKYYSYYSKNKTYSHNIEASSTNLNFIKRNLKHNLYLLEDLFISNFCAQKNDIGKDAFQSQKDVNLFDKQNKKKVEQGWENQDLSGVSSNQLFRSRPRQYTDLEQSPPTKPYLLRESSIKLINYFYVSNARLQKKKTNRFLQTILTKFLDSKKGLSKDKIFEKDTINIRLYNDNKFEFDRQSQPSTLCLTSLSTQVAVKAHKKKYNNIGSANLNQVNLANQINNRSFLSYWLIPIAGLVLITPLKISDKNILSTFIDPTNWRVANLRQYSDDLYSIESLRALLYIDSTMRGATDNLSFFMSGKARYFGNTKQTNFYNSFAPLKSFYNVDSTHSWSSPDQVQKLESRQNKVNLTNLSSSENLRSKRWFCVKHQVNYLKESQLNPYTEAEINKLTKQRQSRLFLDRELSMNNVSRQRLASPIYSALPSIKNKNIEYQIRLNPLASRTFVNNIINFLKTKNTSKIIKSLLRKKPFLCIKTYTTTFQNNVAKKPNVCLDDLINSKSKKNVVNCFTSNNAFFINFGSADSNLAQRFLLRETSLNNVSRQRLASPICLTSLCIKHTPQSENLNFLTLHKIPINLMTTTPGVENHHDVRLWQRYNSGVMPSYANIWTSLTQHDLPRLIENGTNPEKTIPGAHAPAFTSKCLKLKNINKNTILLNYFLYERRFSLEEALPTNFLKNISEQSSAIGSPLKKDNAFHAELCQQKSNLVAAKIVMPKNKTSVESTFEVNNSLTRMFDRRFSSEDVPGLPGALARQRWDQALPKLKDFKTLKRDKPRVLSTVVKPRLRANIRKAKNLNNIKILFKHQKMFTDRRFSPEVGSAYNNSLTRIYDPGALARQRTDQLLKSFDENFKGSRARKRSFSQEVEIKNQKHLFQKKRKAKKQRLETRRQKKRTRFFPRPTWLRYRMFTKFLKQRNPLYNNALYNTKEKKSGQVSTKLQGSFTFLRYSPNFKGLNYLRRISNEYLLNNSRLTSNWRRLTTPLYLKSLTRHNIRSGKANKINQYGFDILNRKTYFYLRDLKLKGNYISFKNQKTNQPPLPNTSKDQNTLFRDFWIWTYNNPIKNNYTLTNLLNHRRFSSEVGFANSWASPDQKLFTYDLSSIDSLHAFLNLQSPFSPTFWQKFVDHLSHLLVFSKPLPKTGQAFIQLNNYSTKELRKTYKLAPPILQRRCLIKNMFFNQRIYWALNKTNTNSFTDFNKRYNLWGSQKLRNQSKNNKTKDLEKSFFNKYNIIFTINKNFNLFNKKMSIKTKEKSQKINYLTSYPLTSIKKQEIGYTQKKNLKSSNIKFFNTNYFSNLNFTLKNFNSNRFSLEAATLAPIQQKQHFLIESFFLTNKTSFKLKQNSLDINNDIKNCNVAFANLINNIDYQYISNLNLNGILRSPLTRIFDQINLNYLSIIFYLLIPTLTVISLLSISQVRCFLKFHVIIFYKLTTFYNWFNTNNLLIIDKITKNIFTNQKAFVPKAKNLKIKSMEQNLLKITKGNPKHKKVIKKSVNVRNHLTYFGLNLLTKNFKNRKNKTYNYTKLNIISKEFGSSWLNANKVNLNLYNLSNNVFDRRFSLEVKKFKNPLTKISDVGIDNSWASPDQKPSRTMGLMPKKINVVTTNKVVLFGTEKFGRQTWMFGQSPYTLFRILNVGFANMSGFARHQKGKYLKYQIYKAVFVLSSSKNLTKPKKLFLGIVDLLRITLRMISNFFEKPAEYTTTWIAYGFLVEWSSDLITLIPENVDISTWNIFSKLTRTTPIIYTTAMTPVSLVNVIQPSTLLFNKKLNSKMYNLTNLIFSPFLIISSYIINKKFIVYLFDLLFERISQPDTDLIRRQEKGTLFWDIWADFLVTAADFYNVNIAALSTIKAEQNLLIEKISSSENLRSNLGAEPSSVMLGSSLEATIQKKVGKDWHRQYNKLSSNKYSQSSPFNENRITKTSNSLTKTYFKPIVKNPIYKNLNLNIYDIYQNPKTNKNLLKNQKGITFFGRILKNKTKLASPIGLTSLSIKNSNRWAVNQFITYQSWHSHNGFNNSNLNLFIDYHPPKSFQHIPAIRYNQILQQPIGTLVCQIYSGLFNKQISKNVLLVNTNLKKDGNFEPFANQSSGENLRSTTISGVAEPLLLIQALAGETELKIITDNAQRYAVINRGFAIGIKLLRDVFDAIALNTPCIFVLEDIHKIGERRPMLISDYGGAMSDDNGSFKEDFFGTQRDEVHEKNQIVYQLTRHKITHYKKPFKGDYSLAIPTNLYVSDLFLKEPTQTISNLSLIENHNLTIKNKIKINKTQANPISQRGWLSHLNFKQKNKVNNNFLTSPFSVLLLKEEKKLKPNKIVEELPWTGLPSEQLLTKPRTSYSVRTKVLMLAELSLTNISAKLDMITDLLVIIDSVRSTKGFVVFATTNVPSILDPALRRPGRLDETICLKNSFNSFVLNFHTNFEMIKTGKTKKLNTIHFKDLQNPQTYFNFYNKKLPTMKNKTTNSYPGKPGNRVNQIKPLTRIFDRRCSPEDPCAEASLQRKLQDQKLKPKDLEQSPTVGFAKINQVNLINQMRALAYNEVGKTMLNFYLNLAKTKLDRVYLDASSLSYAQIQNNLLHTSSVINYLSLYGSKNKLTLQLMLLFAGKISEFISSKTLSTKKIEKENLRSKHDIQHPKNFLPLARIFDQNVAFGAQILASPIYANLRSYPDQFMSTGLLDKNNSHMKIILSFIQKRYLYGQNLVVPKLLSFIDGNVLEEPPSPPFSNLLIPSKRYENYLRVFRDFIFGEKIGQRKSEISVMEKVDYHIRLNSIKLLNNRNLNDPCAEAKLQRKLQDRRFSSEVDFGNSHLASIVDPEAYAEAKLQRKDQEVGSENSWASHLDSLKNPNFVLPTKNNNNITNINWYYQNRILKRHGHYLTNQWWNGQLSEHNPETVFLSDIDWRASFIKNKKLKSSNEKNELGLSKALSSNEIDKSTKGKSRRNSPEDVLLDFPDTEQFYNPRRRRWLLNKGYWSFWFNLEKSYSEEIINTWILESIIQTYSYLYNNTELLDFLTTKFIIEGPNIFLKNKLINTKAQTKIKRKRDNKQSTGATNGGSANLQMRGATFKNNEFKEILLTNSFKRF